MAKAASLIATLSLLLLLISSGASPSSDSISNSTAATDQAKFGVLSQVACHKDSECKDKCGGCPAFCGHPCPTWKCLITNCWCSCQ